MHNVRAEFARRAAAPLSLDLTRGKPSPQQLRLLDPFYSVVGSGSFLSKSGIDCANYGPPIDGLPEARQLFAGILQAPPEAVAVHGSSSLALMAMAFQNAAYRGVLPGEKPWRTSGGRGIALVPGYDRHFAVAANCDVPLVPVEIREDGSHWDQLERLVTRDSSFRMVWLVPRYSNPTGGSLTEAEIQRMAAMTPAADDFRWFVDHAYAVHCLDPEDPPIASIYDAFAAAGKLDLLYLFGSTAKILWAGSAVGALAASPANREALVGQIAAQFVTTNKLEQLRAVRAIEQYPGQLPGLMRDHAAILRPRFSAVDEALIRWLGADGMDGQVQWSRPKGGYFINLTLPNRTAKRVVELCKQLGVALTPAGATYPGGHDPADSNLRIAPSFPSLADITAAADVLGCAIRYALEVAEE